MKIVQLLSVLFVLLCNSASAQEFESVIPISAPAAPNTPVYCICNPPASKPVIPVCRIENRSYYVYRPTWINYTNGVSVYAGYQLWIVTQSTVVCK